ncbi:MAG: hypothetical protein AB8F34_09360 [Akkermansiaceae bacterium]
MKKNEREKITIELPTSVYHALRNEAKRRGLDLPEFIRRKIELKPADPSLLAGLPLREILSRTTPADGGDRLDFFH